MPSDVICLRVPLRSWTRFRTARMNLKIVQHALQILERHEMNKHTCREEECDERERDQLIDRIVKMEKTLKTMEDTLKAISSKLTVDKIKSKKPKTKIRKRRKRSARKSITKSPKDSGA